MGATLSDFIRWAREEVLHNPEVVNYEFLIDDAFGVPGPEFGVDHDAKGIIFYIRAEVDDDFDAFPRQDGELDDNLEEDEEGNLI